MVQQPRQPKAGWAGDDADDTDDFLQQQLQPKNYYYFNIHYKSK